MNLNAIIGREFWGILVLRIDKEVGVDGVDLKKCMDDVANKF